MVGLLIRLKLTLLKNSLKRSVWRTIGLVIGLLYALGVVIGVLMGMVALRWTSTALTADVTVVAFSALTLGWLLMSLLVFGVDETVDPGKFAVLPLRSTDLLPGLFLAGFVGSPGIATVLASSGSIIAWARNVPLAMAAVVAFPLGVATCLLLSRAGTAGFARYLSSRRFRDFALVALALLGLVMAWPGTCSARSRGPGRASCAAASRMRPRWPRGRPSVGHGRFPPTSPAATGVRPRFILCWRADWSPCCGGFGDTSSVCVWSSRPNPRALSR